MPPPDAAIPAGWDPMAELSASQRDRLAAYRAQLLRFNRTLNLVSRDSEQEVDARHLRHSLLLAWRAFPDGATVVDWGTGGGLPAIPLAIRFPNVRFVAVDSIEKKTNAVKTMARRLDLPNLTVWNGRAEHFPMQADYAVSRATAPLADLWRWTAPVLRPCDAGEGCWRPGFVGLKGGDLSGEIAQLQAAFPDAEVRQTGVDRLDPARFAEKCIVEVTGQSR